MYGALQGNNPKFTLRELSWSSIKDIGEVAVIEEKQKLPLILSHIPFLGTYLEERYGEFLKSGEKFGNWAFLIAAVFIWIDPSLTLLITWITLVTFWIVYQSVLVTSGDSLRLIGSKLPGVGTCHIWIRSAIKYCKLLVNHDEKIPVWSETQLEQSHSYEALKAKLSNPKLSVPFINIPSIIHGFKTEGLLLSLFDAIIIDIIIIYALYFGHTPLLMIALLASWCSYWQAKSGK